MRCALLAELPLAPHGRPSSRQVELRDERVLVEAVVEARIEGTQAADSIEKALFYSGLIWTSVTDKLD